MKVMKTKEIEEAFQDWEAKNKAIKALDSYDRRQKEYRQLEKAETVYYNLVVKQAKVQADEFATSKGFTLVGAKVAVKNAYPKNKLDKEFSEWGIETRGYYDAVWKEQEILVKLKEIAEKVRKENAAEKKRKEMMQSVECSLKELNVEFKPSREKLSDGFEYDNRRTEFRDTVSVKDKDCSINLKVTESWRDRGTPRLSVDMYLEGISEEQCAEFFAEIQRMWEEVK